MSSWIPTPTPALLRSQLSSDSSSHSPSDATPPSPLETASTPTPSVDWERIATHILGHYNKLLKCEECNQTRSINGAFNKDRAGAFRRYRCSGKGKPVDPCNRSYTPNAIWKIALQQLPRDAVEALVARFPEAISVCPSKSIIAQPPANDQQTTTPRTQVKRPRDTVRTGATPKAKRVSTAANLSSPPPFNLAPDEEITELSYRLTQMEEMYDALKLRVQVLEARSLGLDDGEPSSHPPFADILIADTPVSTGSASLSTAVFPPDLKSDCIPETPDFTAPDFASPLMPSSLDVLDGSQEGVDLGSPDNTETYAQVVGRPHLPHCHPQAPSTPHPVGRSSPSPRPMARDAAASNHNLSVVYLTLPPQVKPKVGKLREQLAKADLSTINISLIGSTYAEVLLDGVDSRSWMAAARNAGWDIADRLDPTDLNHMVGVPHLRNDFKALKACLISRIKNEINSGFRRRAKEFYQDWLAFLGPWADADSTPKPAT